MSDDRVTIEKNDGLRKSSESRVKKGTRKKEQQIIQVNKREHQGNKKREGKKKPIMVS